MTEPAAMWMSRIRRRTRAILRGPHLLAFLPAISLGAFWLGGEGVLILISLLMPIAFAVGGMFSRDAGPQDSRSGSIAALYDRDWLIAKTAQALDDGPTNANATVAFAIGIDEFAELAERHGHDVAASAIEICADRCREISRPGDLVARLNGSSLCIVQNPGSRTDLEAMIQFSTRIQRRLEDAISLDGTRLYLTASVGFCTSKNAPELSGQALIECAEHALGDAAASGTGTVRAFSRDMKRRAHARGELADEFPAALENGQIRPWFQPQIETATGAVAGVEVLARWKHPDRGLVPPAEFLDIAENLGLIERLGEVMLYQSLNALRAWDAAGTGIPRISLNFTAEELRNPMIVDRIRWELDRFEIAPERLNVEVLETVIAQTTNDTIIRNLRAFAELGCTIDLDDFGTGHASIANIKRFSVGRIKIDRSFVTLIDKDVEQQNIVSAIITLAERLELETLAEGVETAGELAILRQMNCRYLQGFAIARPMPFPDVEAWMNARLAARSDRSSTALTDVSGDSSETPATQGKTA